MKKWEYLYHADGKRIKGLNEYGKEGWELVGFAIDTDVENSTVWEYIFKRQIEDENDLRET